MSALRNFGISFAVALLIFALSAYFILDFAKGVFENRMDEIGNDTGPDSNIYDPDIGNNAPNQIKSGRSFNMVIIGTDLDTELHHDYTETEESDQLFIPRKVKATAILFARFDKENKALRLSTVPSETVVTVDHVKMTLGEAYHFKGPQFIRDQVASLVGSSVDFYFCFSGKEFSNYTDQRLLTSDYKVPFTVFTNSKNGLPARTFVKDSIIDDPKSLYTLLHFTDYTFENINNRYLLIQSIFLQTLKKTSVTNNPDTYYNLFISGLKTDMQKKDVSELIEVLTALSINIGKNQNPTEITVIDFYKQGGYDDKGLFYPDEASLKQVFSEYKTK